MRFTHQWIPIGTGLVFYVPSHLEAVTTSESTRPERVKAGRGADAPSGRTWESDGPIPGVS